MASANARANALARLRAKLHRPRRAKIQRQGAHSTARPCAPTAAACALLFLQVRVVSKETDENSSGAAARAGVKHR